MRKIQRTDHLIATGSRKVLKGTEGVLSIPLALVMAVVVTAALGSIGLMELQRREIALQLAMDTCVGKAALHLKKTLTLVEAANSRMQMERVTAQAMTVFSPPAMEALKAALQLEASLQDLQIQFWNFKRARWLAERGCATGSVPWPLPELKWVRPLPDFWGQKPLDWLGRQPSEFQIEVDHSPRSSAARVLYTQKKIELTSLTKRNWYAEWTSARFIGMHRSNIR